MKKIFQVLGPTFIVFFLVIFSGCATFEGVKRDVRALQDKALKALSPAPPPVISLAKIPRREHSFILRAVAECEPQYVPPSKMNPARAEYSVDEVEARHRYESCLQISLNETLSSDLKYREKEKSSCAKLKGNRRDDCLEWVRVATLSEKARDLMNRRDNATSGSPPAKVVRKNRTLKRR